MNDNDLLCADCDRRAEPFPLVRAAQCPRCLTIVLPPDLEDVWLDMEKLRQHPRFWDGIEACDPRFRETCASLLHIPRIWLADGRKKQVEGAMRSVREALRERPLQTRG